ncbi:oligosaccharide flippase family protein [Winogradskyella bathintestinalis]|uniref:Oligosaccharide flippase family protein n=1 Tax=Winogradskyella bathintestinalis TaxID=3035208 RepID=A0ABT7ZRG4_9FLAO|nr:oligosaccharide flippase family protein [Winogradskyella bathintestinalis]MDN3491584.1 oligosaccharide flippase family protein [Winogradskyella bathintestinalis]
MKLNPKFSKILDRNRKIIENFSYLSVLQVLNMLIPLVIFPYLIRVLGSTTYGLVIYAQAIIGYFVVLINFGFNITATKEISINKDNSEKLNKIISSVFILKGIFFIISVVILTALIVFIPELRDNKLLFYLTLWLCVYELIFPVYYFQGIEEMKYITIITLISRSIFLLLTFLLVNETGDYLLVPIINGTGALIAGIVSQYIIIKKGIRYAWQPLRILKLYIKKSYIMALAYASNTLKTNLNIVIVKFLFSYKEVAYFDLALKISRIGMSFLELISISIFPKMSRDKNKFFLRKIIYICIALSFGFVLAVQFLAPLLVSILGGEDMTEAIFILKVVVFFVPLEILSGLFGRNCLIIHGYDKDVLYSMALSSLVYILTIIIVYFSLGNQISLFLLSLIFVFSFMVDALYRYIMCRKYNIL